MIVKELLEEIERLRDVYPDIDLMSVGAVIIEPKDDDKWDADVYYGRSKFVQIRDSTIFEIVGRICTIKA